MLRETDKLCVGWSVILAADCRTSHSTEVYAGTGTHLGAEMLVPVAADTSNLPPAVCYTTVKLGASKDAGQLSQGMASVERPCVLTLNTILLRKRNQNFPRLGPKRLKVLLTSGPQLIITPRHLEVFVFCRSRLRVYKKPI